MADTAQNPDTKLADYLCFSVYTANLAYSRVYRPVLEALGVTYPQYVTLISLYEQDRQTVKALAANLFLEPSTMTPMLKRLEAAGYVSRTRSTEDERSVIIALTEAGRRLREKGLAYAPITRRATGLSPQEISVLQKAIIALRDNLAKAAEESNEALSQSGI